MLLSLPRSLGVKSQLMTPIPLMGAISYMIFAIVTAALSYLYQAKDFKLVIIKIKNHLLSVIFRQKTSPLIKVMLLAVNCNQLTCYRMRMTVIGLLNWLAAQLMQAKTFILQSVIQLENCIC
ncbi:hypothetical protein BSQ99_24605 [Serratia liquefaciens]|nr:hypothetical protein BSQ99_24605 [Serratia liquefaciens]